MQLERIKSFIRTNNLFSKGETVVVAVSGGPDSLCLLHLLKSISSELELKLVVAHLNHALRPEASQEENAVKELALSWSLPFESKTVDIRKNKKVLSISEEEAGRRARYNFLFSTARKYTASRIALGHHLGDQAETVLFNIIRGTGVDGLAGMLPLYNRGKVKLVRPLLCLKRSEIEEYCREHDLQPFTDSSNLETNYTRNKIRIKLIPQLEKEYNPKVREALANLAFLAAEDREYLQGLARQKLMSVARLGRNTVVINRIAFVDLPPALQGRVLRIALQDYLTSGQISRAHISQLIKLAEGWGSGGPLNLPAKIQAYRIYNRLLLTRRSVKRSTDLESILLKIPGKTDLPDGRYIDAVIKNTDELKWPPLLTQAYIDCNSIPSGSVTVCSRWPGARFQPQGSPGSKKLKKIFIDHKVPLHRRRSMPLVAVGEEIIWVVGLRVGEPYRVTEQTKQVLVLSYRQQ